jgi:hypothetical protein
MKIRKLVLIGKKLLFVQRATQNTNMHCVSMRYTFLALNIVVQIVTTRPEKANIVVSTDCYGY